MTILATRPGTPPQRRHIAVCPRCGRERQAEQEVWA